MDSFDPVTRQGLEITNLFWLELVISALLLALVVGWLATALVRFRARPGDAAEPVQVHGNRRLEVIWTSAPILTLIVIFILMVQTMRSVEASSADAVQLKIIGHQFWWEFVYPDGQAIAANEVHVPVGTSLTVSLDSADVIHSFHVPQFGWMRDLVPGKTNQMALFVDRPGTYDGTCNQYCGAQHAWMRVRVVAEPADRFQTWLRTQAAPASGGGGAGQQVFTSNTCVSCHTIRGVSSAANVGPDLTHVGSRTTLGAGVVDNTPEMMRRWLRNAAQVKPGVLMPPFGNLSDADLNALANYMESLK